MLSKRPLPLPLITELPPPLDTSLCVLRCTSRKGAHEGVA
jgi:hypothetical protein